MPSDDEDTPKGALIALTLITFVVLFIVISTFESCTDLEGDRIRNLCSDIRFSMENVFRETSICFTSNGTLKFSIVNTGERDIEGITLRFMGKQFNSSKPTYVMSSEQYSISIGNEGYDLMAPVEVIPLIYYEPRNTTEMCPTTKQTIRDAKQCLLD